MRTISIVNQEPCNGKTTTAINLAAAIAGQGQKVLLVDADPTGRLTQVLGIDLGKKPLGLYDVVTGAAEMPAAVMETGIESVGAVGADIRLAAAEYELAGVLGREFVLGEELTAVSETYDVCLIDCGPFLGLLTLNALVASEEVIVPVRVGDCSVVAIEQLLGIVEDVAERFAPCAVKVRGLLQTLAEPRKKTVQQAQRRLKRKFKGAVLKTVIDKSPGVSDAMQAGEPVLSYSPRSKGSSQYKALAEEIVNG